MATADQRFTGRTGNNAANDKISLSSPTTIYTSENQNERLDSFPRASKRIILKKNH